jgi:hypothetical protein
MVMELCIHDLAEITCTICTPPADTAFAAAMDIEEPSPFYRGPLAKGWTLRSLELV